MSLSIASVMTLAKFAPFLDFKDNSNPFMHYQIYFPVFMQKGKRMIQHTVHSSRETEYGVKRTFINVPDPVNRKSVLL